MAEESVIPIVSKVFLGNLEGAEDEELLLKLGISHVLTVDIQAPKMSANMVRQLNNRYYG